MQKTLEYYLSLDYPVEIRRIEDSLGIGYVASIPSLGSYAFVGEGETPQEAYENLQAAKKEIFEDCLKDGLPIPEPVNGSEFEDYSGKLMLRMPRELHAKLAAAAKRNDTSLNQLIVYALGSFEAKVDTVKQAKRVLSCGTGSHKAKKPVEQPAGAYRVVVLNMAPPRAVPATVVSRNETPRPVPIVSGSERNTPWSSTLPSSVTTLTPETS